MGKLDGKVCIITGCASGLGKQEAIRFADEGAKLAICSRTLSKLEETKRICEERGAEVLAMAVDVTEADQREKFIDAVVEQYGTIDVLVNNAHTTTELLPFMAKTLEDLELETKCCIYAYFHFCQLCVPHMMGHDGYGASSSTLPPRQHEKAPPVTAYMPQ